MAGELVTLKMLSVCASEQDGELMRQGASAAAIPSLLINATSAAAARNVLAEGSIDVAFVETAMARREQQEIVASLRALANRPAVILVAPTSREAAELAGRGADADGIVAKPAKVPDAKALIESACRLKVASAVLMVDDSASMRRIVRKVLASSRFPLEVTEAKEGIEALRRIGASKFDLVFLDYTMPGLNGIETLMEIRRQYPRIGVVLMSSPQDETLAERARAAGAAAFLSKPFYPSDVDAVLYTYHRLRPPPPADNVS
jgi:two-component system, chemotaxis family, chemotaxis protein CheY